MEVIAQDPRPAYQQGKETDRIYGISLYEFNIKWRIKAGTTDCVEILDIQKLKEQKSWLSSAFFLSFYFELIRQCIQHSFDERCQWNSEKYAPEPP